MVSWRSATLAVLALCGRADAQRAEADAEFQRGRTLMDAGRTAEACMAFEASMNLDPEKGTLYNLGLCHEKLGKLATAWSELLELSRTDTNQARAKDAGKRAAALEPRLTRMHLVVAEPVEGLHVTRDGVDVTPLLGKDAPVDPARYTFEATAPGRDPYTHSLDLTIEGKTIEIDIPALHAGGGGGGGSGPVENSGYPRDLPNRPILIPHGIQELTADAALGTARQFDRVGAFASAGGRARLGPFEVSALVEFIVRSGVVMNKPNPWDTVGLAIRYPIDPAFVVGLSYAERQPLRDADRGSDLAGNVERKLLLGPKVAVDGLGGLMFSQRQTDGDAFVVFGQGRAQFAVTGPVSVEALTGLRFNLAGDLYPYTVGLDVAAGALVSITPRLDVFARVSSSLLPTDANGEVRRYTVGANWRTH